MWPLDTLAKEFIDNGFVTLEEVSEMVWEDELELIEGMKPGFQRGFVKPIAKLKNAVADGTSVDFLAALLDNPTAHLAEPEVVRGWLCKRVNHSGLVPGFLEQGYDTLAAVAFMTPANLETIDGWKKIWKNKMLKAIEELKGAFGEGEAAVDRLCASFGVERAKGGEGGGGDWHWPRFFTFFVFHFIFFKRWRT